MKWINSQINQAIKLRCLKIVQTLLSNQEKRRMREKYFNQSLRNALGYLIISALIPNRPV